MSPLKTLWGLLFRLFPCPTATGLRAVGSPGPDSPVLVTCNFHNTVSRLCALLRRRQISAWILVADSKGVNVWCAAGGDELNTDAVVTAVKTCDVAAQVDHRTLVLPPLSAPGVDAAELAERTGWKTRWGPVRFHELPAYLAGGQRRTEAMKRATYSWTERLDTALGSLFPFYLLGALAFAIFGPGLLPTYGLVGAAVFLLYFSLVPWLPGQQGLVKALPLLGLGGIALGLSYAGLVPALDPARPALIIGLAALLVNASELGGLSSTGPSDFDPLLARLGVGAIGNTAFAGTVRTALLNGERVLHHAPQTCTRCRTCVEVCPQGVWAAGDDGTITMIARDRCTACRACLTNCPPGAITAISPPGDSR